MGTDLDNVIEKAEALKRELCYYLDCKGKQKHEIKDRMNYLLDEIESLED